MKIFANVPKIDFMAQRKLGLWTSGLLTVVVIVLLTVRGLNFGIDFTGGVLVEIGYSEPVTLDEVRNHLQDSGFESAVVQSFGTARDILIRMPPADDSAPAALGERILAALNEPSNPVSLRRVEFVGPQIGDELTEKGGQAMIIAFLMIAAYIWFRFEWKFSVGCIAALLHDALMTLGLLSALRVEFDLTTLAAILALIGYSNNETIVIYDRIRENLLNQRRMSVLDVVNLSVNQTLLRSIITHLTTLLTCVALFFLGGPSVHSFSLAMILGVIVATYSSIYVSTGLAVALGISRDDLLPKQDEVDEMP